MERNLPGARMFGDVIQRLLGNPIKDDLHLVGQLAIAAHFQVGRKKVKLANPQVVLVETGFGVGAMPPFGHLSPLPTLIDEQVLEKDQVYAGGGSDRTLLRIDPQVILFATQGTVLDLINFKTHEPENQAY